MAKSQIFLRWHVRFSTWKIKGFSNNFGVSRNTSVAIIRLHGLKVKSRRSSKSRACHSCLRSTKLRRLRVHILHSKSDAIVCGSYFNSTINNSVIFRWLMLKHEQPCVNILLKALIWSEPMHDHKQLTQVETESYTDLVIYSIYIISPNNCEWKVNQN